MSNYCDYVDYNTNPPINDNPKWVDEDTNATLNEPYVRNLEDLTRIDIEAYGALDYHEYELWYRPIEAPKLTAGDCTGTSIMHADDLITCAAAHQQGWRTILDNSAWVVGDEGQDVIRFSIEKGRNLSPWNPTMRDFRDVMYDTFSVCLTLVELDNDGFPLRLSNEVCTDASDRAVVHTDVKDAQCKVCPHPYHPACTDCFTKLTCAATQASLDNRYTFVGCTMPCMELAVAECAVSPRGEKFCGCDKGMSINNVAVCKKNWYSFSEARMNMRGAWNSLKEIPDEPTGTDSASDEGTDIDVTVEIKAEDELCSLCSSAFDVASCGRCALGGLKGVQDNPDAVFPPDMTLDEAWGLRAVPFKGTGLPACFESCVNIELTVDGKDYTWGKTNDLTGIPSGTGIGLTITNIPKEHNTVWGVYFDYDQSKMQGKDIFRWVDVQCSSETFVDFFREEGVTYETMLEVDARVPSALVTRFKTVSNIPSDYDTESVHVQVIPRKSSPYLAAEALNGFFVDSIRVTRLFVGTPL